MKKKGRKSLLEHDCDVYGCFELEDSFFQSGWWVITVETLKTFCTIFSYGFVLGLGIASGISIVMTLLK